jgi:hypothetical protein
VALTFTKRLGLTRLRYRHLDDLQNLDTTIFVEFHGFHAFSSSPIPVDNPVHNLPFDTEM